MYFVVSFEIDSSVTFKLEIINNLSWIILGWKVLNYPGVKTIKLLSQISSRIY